MGKKQETDDQILAAFSEMILEHGYTGTTTRALAEAAGVNEITIFRHFKDKRGLLTQLIDRYLSDIDQIGADFEMTGDIEDDLRRAATLYATFIQQHQAIFLLALRDAYRFPEISAAVQQLPLRLKAILTTAFTQMQASHEIRTDIDVAQQVTNFILINFGNAVFNNVFPQGRMGAGIDQFTAENIQGFAHLLKIPTEGPTKNDSLR